MQEMLASDDVTQTKLYSLLSESQTQGLSLEEIEKWTIGLDSLKEKAEAWKTTEWGELKQQIAGNIQTIADNINVNEQAVEARTTSMVTNLQKQGFEVEDFNTYSSSGSVHGGGTEKNVFEHEQYLDKFEDFSKLEGNTNVAAAKKAYTAMGGANGQDTDGNKLLT
jgi:hypothetical protein